MAIELVTKNKSIGLTQSSNSTINLESNSNNAINLITEKENINLEQPGNTAFELVIPGGEAKDLNAMEVVTPQMFGAIGDGIADDTDAFKYALANNRVVYVNGGTYKLSKELVIEDNCSLELAQDVVLLFIQTEGNCITINRSSTLRGNHATIKVPYAFSGNVINVDTTTDGVEYAVEPWTRWCPQWKTGRYLTDLNICKTNSKGFHYSDDGKCMGTAVYISANGGAVHSTYIWGLNFSGLRIAGAFSYGIRAANFDGGWNHEMRLEAFIDACEIGISLEHCNKAYINASIQPRASGTEIVKSYAKHGVLLINSKDVDLTGLRVWDWDAERTLWTGEASDCIYQHIALYGDCSGLILSDSEYHRSSHDIRTLIYTDTPNNLENNSLIILQEPFTRWFYPKDGLPFFHNGDKTVPDKRLAFKEELDANFETIAIPNFSNELAKAIEGASGAIYNEVGYARGVRLALGSGELMNNYSYMLTTGFIPVKSNDILYTSGFTFDRTSGYNGIVYYDKNFVRLTSISAPVEAWVNLLRYVEDGEGGCSFKIYSFAGTTDSNGNDLIAYVRLTTMSSCVGQSPVITINKEITYSQLGSLAERVMINGKSVILASPGGAQYTLSVADDGTLFTVPYKQLL